MRQLHDDIDYSFVLNELRDKYSEDMGRVAECPIRMFKYCLLKVMTDLSDEDLVEEVKMNMAHKFFLDMAPEDSPIASSTLCKFRKIRLKDIDMLNLLITKTIDMAIDKGILRRSDIDGKCHINVIIDGTHTVSTANLYRPIPALKEYSKRLRAKLYAYEESLKGIIENDHNISGNDLDGEIAYGYRLIGYISDKLPELLEINAIKRIFNRFKELLDDITDHYSVSVSDPDARLGHKSADTEFFGYKTQIGIDEDTGLIVGAGVTSGEVGDALPGIEVMKEILSNENLKVDEMLGDVAYSGTPFLKLGTKHKFKIIAPPHPNLGLGIDGRDGFYFNKDADMFCCPMGHMAISARTVQYKKDNGRRSKIYRFDKDKCNICPMKQTCLGKANTKTFSVSVLSSEQKALLEDAKTDYFKQRRRQRYKIEAKNAHLKQGYGYDKADCKGIIMMELQSAITIFLSNLKTIYGKKAK